ncbi:hypothetical protein BH23ACT6_BH23ACT6_17570 [soil metagenome]
MNPPDPPRRRAQRAATDGVPETHRADSGRESVGEPETGTDEASTAADLTEQWWREQRPPHWE